MPGDAETAVILEGTLAYTSPEQTGRITPPFQPDDALAMVHCHLAKMPVPLCDLPTPGPSQEGNVSISKGRLIPLLGGRAVKFFAAQECKPAFASGRSPVKLSRRSREAHARLRS